MIGKLEELLNSININIHEVNLENLYLYAAITKEEDINKESLINFFGENLYKPNKDGEYLTHILCSHAFIGSLNFIKTTKLFSFIYELINPNLPGKNSCSSIMEFIVCSLDRLELNTSSYLKYLLNLHYLNNYDIFYSDIYGYELSVYLLTAFALGSSEIMLLFNNETEVSYDLKSLFAHPNNISLNMHVEFIGRCNERCDPRDVLHGKEMEKSIELFKQIKESRDFTCYPDYPYTELDEDWEWSWEYNNETIENLFEIKRCKRESLYKCFSTENRKVLELTKGGNIND